MNSFILTLILVLCPAHVLSNSMRRTLNPDNNNEGGVPLRLEEIEEALATLQDEVASLRSKVGCMTNASSFSIDAYGDLIYVDCKDGSSSNLGKVTGERGPSGANCYDGIGTSVDDCHGETGPQGIQGEAGERGPSGNDGVDGVCQCPPDPPSESDPTPDPTPDPTDSTPPLQPACNSGVVANEVEPCTVSPVASSCKEHYDLGRISDGMYCVDPGSAGAAFEVWCDQTSVVAYGDKVLTGGWALFAYRDTSTCYYCVEEPPVETVDPREKANMPNVVSTDEHWLRLRDFMYEGAMFIDELEQVAFVQRNSLVNANCKSICQSNSLQQRNNVYDDTIYWSETSGCSISGGDYCFFGTTDFYYQTVHNACSQNGFDIWPYDCTASYCASVGGREHYLYIR